MPEPPGSRQSINSTFRQGPLSYIRIEPSTGSGVKTKVTQSNTRIYQEYLEEDPLPNFRFSGVQNPVGDKGAVFVLYDDNISPAAHTISAPTKNVLYDEPILDCKTQLAQTGPLVCLTGDAMIKADSVLGLDPDTDTPFDSSILLSKRDLYSSDDYLHLIDLAKRTPTLIYWNTRRRSSQPSSPGSSS